MIRAELVEGNYIRVAPRGLDLLLRNGRIKRFLRAAGWVVVGVDPIRDSARSEGYNGPERRKAARDAASAAQLSGPWQSTSPLAQA